LPVNDRALLIEAARLAGDIATRFWRQSPETWEKSGGAGPVTEADIAVNDMLCAKLMAARPDYGWLSEESDDTSDRLSRQRVFIIDPIDGTRSFIAGDKTWSHSLAVADNGHIIAGVVFLPLHDKLYCAHLSGGAFLNDAHIHASAREELDGATVLSARANLDASHWRQGPPPIERHFRASLAYRMALVAEGRFDAMLSLRDTWEWDVAAGTLIATEAGARVTDKNGAAPAFNNARPMLPGILAGTAAVHESLLARLRSGQVP
jgi:myo-inositol-1(or 4)-monophosphatase